MNCQDIADLMDERDIGKLSASERDNVAAHLATCADCAGDWHAFERLHSRPPADMRADFPERLWLSLIPALTGALKSGRGARPWLLGGMLLVGAAAALVSWQSRRDLEPESIGSVPEAREEIPVNSPLPSQAIGSSAATTAPTVPGAVPASGRRRIILLPTVYENRSPVAIDSVNAIRPAMLQVLRTLPNVEVVEVVQAQIDAAGIDYPGRAELPAGAARSRLFGGMSDYPIAVHFGGDFSLRFYDQNYMALMTQAARDFWTIEVRWRGANGGGTASVQISDLQATAEARGDELARELYGQLFPQAARAVWEMVVVDVAQPESRRLEALSRAQGRSGPEIPPGLADATVESAIDLARTSTDPATRSRIWQILGNYAYPAAREPIIDALLYDPDAAVRRMAARVLYSYIPDPQVSAALARVSEDDESDAVRLQARWSVMSGRERDAFVNAALRDPALGDEQKVAPLRFLRRNYDDPLDPASLRILDEISVRGAEPATRSVALIELGRSADPSSLDALINALNNDADATVRRTAMSAMAAHRDGSGTYEAQTYNDPLISALTRDPDPEVRGTAVDYLRMELATPGVTAALENALAREADPEVRTSIQQALAPIQNGLGGLRPLDPQ